MKKEKVPMRNSLKGKQQKMTASRSLLSLVLCLLMMLSMTSIWANPNYEVPSDRTKPFLVPDDNIKTLKHGDEFIYDFTIVIEQNVTLKGNNEPDSYLLKDAEPISIGWLVSNDPAVFPIMKGTGRYGKTVINITNGGSNTGNEKKSYSAKLEGYRVHPQASPGRYYIPLEIQYKVGDEVFTQIAYFTVDIEGDAAPSGDGAPPANGQEPKEEEHKLADPIDRHSILMVKEGSVPRLELGQELDLILPIVNRGDQFVRIVNVTPQVGLDDSYPFEITQSDYTRQVETLLAPQGVLGGNYTACGIETAVNFGKVWVKQDIKKGYYKVDFLVRFQDFITRKEVLYPCPDNPSLPCTKEGYRVDLPAEYSEATLSLIFYVNGTGDDAGDDATIPTPRLIITGFTTTPEKIQGGDDFTLRMMLKNASNVTAVQNVRMTFESGEGTPFLPKDGASTRHIQYIDAGGEYEMILYLKASPILEEKIYPLNIGFEYEDYKAKAYTAQETLSIPVYQETRVSIGQIELFPDSFAVGEDASLNFAIYNKGKSKLYNVSITIPEGEAASGKELYLGNIDPGSSRDVDMMIHGEQETDFEAGKVKININYEDANGGTHTVEEEIEMSIVGGGFEEEFPGGMPPDFDGEFPPGFEEDMGPDGGKKILPIWAWILLALVLLIVVLVVISKLLKRKKKRKQAEEDAAFFKQLEEERKLRQGKGGPAPGMRRHPGPRRPRQRR